MHSPNRRNIKNSNASFNDTPSYWDSLSKYPLDAAVIDPRDSLGEKNLYIASLRNAAVAEVIRLDEKSLSILDFGCGTGGLIEFLALKGFRTFGIDISLKMLKRCKEREAHTNPNLVQIDGMNIPFKDESIDLITAYIVLMYVDDNNLSALLRKMAQILRPGGRIVVIEQFRSRGTMIHRHGKLHRSIDSFLGIAKQAGLEEQSTTVCRYGHFPLLYLIRLGLIPRRLFPLIQRMERRVGRILGVLPWDYVDARVVLSKTWQS